MSPELDLGPPTDSRRGGTRAARILVLLLVAVAIWASTATVEWMSESGLRAAQAWNADAGFLGRLSGEFGAASGELQNALAWDNLTWGREAESSLAAAARLAQDGGGAPDGSAMAAILNLTPRNFGCAAYGLTNAFAGIESGQTTWTAQASYLTNLSTASSALATRLRAVRASGTDPIIQLGPASVTQIQTYAGMLYTLVVRDFQSPAC